MKDQSDLKRAKQTVQKLHRLAFSKDSTFDADDELFVAEAHDETWHLIDAKQWHLCDQLYQDFVRLLQKFPNNTYLLQLVGPVLHRMVHFYTIEDLGLQAEQPFGELKKLRSTYPNDIRTAELLATAMTSFVEYYTRTNQSQNVRQIYHDQETLTKEFLRDSLFTQQFREEVPERLIESAYSVVKYCLKSNQWQQVEPAYHNLKLLTLHFTSCKFAITARFIAGTASMVILYHMAENQRHQAEQVYQDLKSVSKRFAGDLYLSYVNTRIMHHMANAKNWGVYKEELLINLDRVKKEIEFITQDSDVELQILQTDKEFYSDETHIRTIKDKMYFISAESPEETSKITRYIVQQAKLRNQLMHSNRVQKAAQNSQNLATRIDEIKSAYSFTHNGKVPSANKIASILTEMKVVSPGGKTMWHAKTVQRIIDAPGESAREK